MNIRLLTIIVSSVLLVSCHADEDIDPGLQRLEETTSDITPSTGEEQPHIDGGTSTTIRVEESLRDGGEETRTEDLRETTPADEEEEEEFAIFQLFSGIGGKGEGEVGERPSSPAPPALAPPVASTPLPSTGQPLRVSHQIRLLLDNYRRYGRVRIPGNPLPDPMPLPDVRRNFAGNPMNFTEVNLYGLSQFEVDHVNTDLDKMQVYIELKMSQLVLLGNYSVRTWFGKGAGPFNVTLLSVVVSGSAQLERDPEGKLRATDTEMDMSFMDSVVDFKNTGMLGSIMQGVLATVGPVLFEAVKPTVLKELNEKLRGDVNARLEAVGGRLGGGEGHPLDRAVVEGRRAVKEAGYDPLHLRDYVLRDPLFRLNVSNLWLHGLSRFSRVGAVSLTMDSGTLSAGAHLATGRLFGRCDWSLSLGNFNRAGAANFTVKQLQVKAFVNQSLDVSKKPVLEKLDIFLGKTTVLIDKKDDVDKFIQYVVNALPAFLRHIIVDTLEEPISIKVQSILNEIDVEDIVNKTLPVLDNIEN